MSKYTNNKLLQEQPNINPTTSYKKNMLFEDSMFDVNESVDESDSLDDNPIMLDESNEDEIEHDPF